MELEIDPDEEEKDDINIDNFHTCIIINIVEWPTLRTNIHSLLHR